jgi:hypothetical protein
MAKIAPLGILMDGSVVCISGFLSCGGEKVLAPQKRGDSACQIQH